ncbi:hypothetical protein X975_06510, partial [Stegodyphus mimosarum]
MRARCISYVEYGWNCTAILKHVQDTLDVPVSTRTISRRLVLRDLHSRRPLRRLPLTPQPRGQRLEWCWTKAMWMTEWRNAMFSDDSRFCLSSVSRRIRVYRRRGHRSNPAVTVERSTCATTWHNGLGRYCLRFQVTSSSNSGHYDGPMILG